VGNAHIIAIVGIAHPTTTTDGFLEFANGIMKSKIQTKIQKPKSVMDVWAIGSDQQ